jgi:ADP-ribose pyrophosphatase YjhB (NUDIX family)
MDLTKVKDTFCSYCGTRYAQPLHYPRKCANAACGVEVWANPIPVSVVLIPVLHGGRTGILVIRRGIEPRRGLLAIVGGFVEEQETWQAAGAREAKEESGVTIDPAGLQPFWFTSTEPRPNRVLLFSVAATLHSNELPPFQADHEATERGLVFGPQGLAQVFSFPLHVQAAERFFQSHNIVGSHDFVAL